MGIQLAIHRFSVEEFHRMGEVGIFSEDDRVELLDGEIIEMTPIGSRHASCVTRLARVLDRQLGDSAVVWVQNPVRLDDRSEPQPDVTLLRSRADLYAQAHPGPEDVLLLIEVAETTVQLDREVKLPLYAKAGICEVWIVDIAEGTVEVDRQPTASGYLSTQQFRASDQLRLEALPALIISVSDILPA